MKSLILFISFLSLFFLYVPQAFSVGGISNTKILVPSTETVPKGKFEFEPFFGLVFVDDSLDSKNFEAGARFTLGASDNIEVGTNITFLTIEDNDSSSADYDFGDISPGIKYRFFNSDRFSLAYQAGITIPTSSDDASWVFEPIGIIFTKDFNNSLSIDADSVLAVDEDGQWAVTSEIGIGHYLNNHIQPVLELAYIFEDSDDSDSSHLVTVTGGFTANITSYLTAIIGLSKDIVSENVEDSLSFSAAFTFLF